MALGLTAAPASLSLLRGDVTSMITLTATFTGLNQFIDWVPGPTWPASVSSLDLTPSSGHGTIDVNPQGFIVIVDSACPYGAYVANFQIRDEDVGGASVFTLPVNWAVVSALSMRKSTMQSPNVLIAGTQSSGITFVAKNASGVTLTTGGDVFTATVTGTNAGSTTSITDNGDGTYGIYYTPPKRGHDVPSVATSNTTTSGDTIPVNPPLPSQQTNPPSSWTYPPGPGTDQGGGAFEQGGGGKFYGGFNGGPSFSDRYSKLAPINDGAGDVNFVYRVDDIAPIIVADTQPVNVIDFPGALEP